MPSIRDGQYSHNFDTTKGWVPPVRVVTAMAHEIVETPEAIEPGEGAPSEASTPPFGGDSPNADLSSLGPRRWIAWGCRSGTTDLGRISV